MIRKTVLAVLSVSCVIVIASWGLSSLGFALELTYFQHAPLFGGVGTKFASGSVEWFVRYRTKPSSPRYSMDGWRGFEYSERRTNFGYGVGRATPTTTSTLRAPSWSLVLLLGWYPAIAFIRGPLRHYRRRKRGLCLRCGYNLEGNVSRTCPECGRATQV